MTSWGQWAAGTVVLGRPRRCTDLEALQRALKITKP